MDMDDGVEDTEVSLIVGAGAPLGSSGTIGVRYSLGMTDLWEDPDVETKTKTLSIFVGISF
jgi:hypothetical protein